MLLFFALTTLLGGLLSDNPSNFRPVRLNASLPHLKMGISYKLKAVRMGSLFILKRALIQSLLGAHSVPHERLLFTQENCKQTTTIS